jgi:hypothetical protein
MTGHNSEFVGASHPMPDPVSDSRYFYCSCGISYTAAHAFHAHCKKTGHDGNWSRSKYQPKGHHLMNVGVDLPSASIKLSPVMEHAVSVEHSPELSKPKKSLPDAEPFNFADSGLGSSIDGKEADASSRADIQAYLLTEESHHSSIGESKEVEADHTGVTWIDSIAACSVEAHATSTIRGTSLTKTIDDADSSGVSNRVNDDVSDSTSNSLRRLSKSFARVRHLIHARPSKGRNTQSDLRAYGFNEAHGPVTGASGKRQATCSRSADSKPRRSRTMLDRLRRPFDTGVKKIGTSARWFVRSIARHKGKLGAAILTAAITAVSVRCLQSQPMLSNVAPTCQLGWLLDLNASAHVVTDSKYYSNVDSVFRLDAQIAKSSNWTGTIPLYFNSGSMLLLEDVLYDAGAHTNVVSLPKLHEAGLFTDFNPAGVVMYNAVTNGPVGRATINENVYCLEDLGPPPPAMTYP